MDAQRNAGVSSLIVSINIRPEQDSQGAPAAAGNSVTPVIPGQYVFRSVQPIFILPVIPPSQRVPPGTIITPKISTIIPILQSNTRPLLHDTGNAESILSMSIRPFEGIHATTSYSEPDPDPDLQSPPAKRMKPETKKERKREQHRTASTKYRRKVEAGKDLTLIKIINLTSHKQSLTKELTALELEYNTFINRAQGISNITQLETVLSGCYSNKSYATFSLIYEQKKDLLPDSSEYHQKAENIKHKTSARKGAEGGEES